MRKALQLPAYLRYLKYLWDTLYNSKRIFYLEIIFLETFYFLKKRQEPLDLSKAFDKNLPSMWSLRYAPFTFQCTKVQAVVVLHTKTFFLHIQNFVWRTAKVINDPVLPSIFAGHQFLLSNFKSFCPTKGEVTMTCKVTNRTPQIPSSKPPIGSVSWNAVDQTHLNYLANGRHISRKKDVLKKIKSTNMYKLKQ